MNIRVHVQELLRQIRRRQDTRRRRREMRAAIAQVDAEFKALLKGRSWRGRSW